VSRERIVSVRVDIHVVTTNGDFRRRVDLDDEEDVAHYVDRIRDRLFDLDVGDAPTDERRFVQAARLVAEHWKSQDGINGKHLDDLVVAYDALTPNQG
jgi:hypothetical protein